MKFFIIHGTFGHPEENWFPWLKKELEKLGHEVIVPQFPTPENQTLINWQKELDKYDIDENTILIGHSLGVPFILSIIEKTKTKAAYLVAGFTGKLNNPELDKINNNIADREFNWNKIQQNCKSFHLFHSDNDPYVPLQKANELSKHLNTKLTIIKSAGHFNEKAGYTEFPELLLKIKNTFKQIISNPKKC